MIEYAYQMGVIQEKEYYEALEKLIRDYYKKHPFERLIQNIRVRLSKSHK